MCDFYMGVKFARSCKDVVTFITHGSWVQDLVLWRRVYLLAKYLFNVMTESCVVDIFISGQMSLWQLASVKNGPRICLATSKQHKRHIWGDINLYMRVLNILVLIVDIRQKEGIIFRNIYKWYMTVLDILVRIVTNRQQEKDVWTHIESLHDDSKYSCPHCDHQATHKENLKTHINLFMMVLNILVLIVTTNQHKRKFE